jgi:hypothetical protein
MIRRYLATAFVTMSLIFAASAEDRKKQTTEEDLEKAIVVATQLLVAKDYRGFLERFMPPDTLADALKTEKIDELAKDEIERRADRWLREFKLMKGVKPEVDQERTHATFRVKDPKGKEIVIKFKQVKDVWYLK